MIKISFQIDETDEKVVTTDKQSNLRYQFVCEIGHVIVIAGAILKSGREINEMSRMSIRKYLSTTVSD